MNDLVFLASILAMVGLSAAYIVRVLKERAELTDKRISGLELTMNGIIQPALKEEKSDEDEASD